MITPKQIKEICLENGFKTKKQEDGSDDLNPYVYTAVQKCIQAVQSAEEATQALMGEKLFENICTQLENVKSSHPFTVKDCYFENTPSHLETAKQVGTFKDIDKDVFGREFL
jgi:hypothetical protein